jgi:DMSO/TMAO reductase YedYZ molybdopterin-dependent catalytic subunit
VTATRLIIHGRVVKPRALTFADLHALPRQVTEKSPLLAGRELGGVPLSALLELAQPLADARAIVAESHDASFRTTLPMASIDHCIIVYRVSGVALPPSLGGPYRLITEGRIGCGDVKQLGALYVSERTIAEPADSELISVLPRG